MFQQLQKIKQLISEGTWSSYVAAAKLINDLVAQALTLLSAETGVRAFAPIGDLSAEECMTHIDSQVSGMKADAEGGGGAIILALLPYLMQLLQKLLTK